MKNTRKDKVLINKKKYVTHFSYSKSGGAGIVAANLAEYQSTYLGFESNFSYLIERSLWAEPLSDPTGTLRAFLDSYIIKKSDWRTLFSLLRDKTVDKARDEIFRNSDIFHFHWISGFIKTNLFLEIVKSGKKIVWTLHDMEPITGGCHQSLECDNYKKSCSACPAVKRTFQALVEKKFDDKKSILSSINKLQVVLPSKWMMAKVKKSPMLGRFPLSVIHNPVKEIFFKNSSNVEKYVNEEITIGFVSQFLHDPNKNYELLKMVVQSLNQNLNGKFKIIAVGHTGKKILSPFITEVGYINSVQNLILTYQKIDVLVSTSYSESFGNTVAEAAAVGIPSIIMKNTACEELVIHGKTGYAVKNFNELYLFLKNYYENGIILKRHSQQAKLFAKKNFHEKVINEKYIELYNNILLEE